MSKNSELDEFHVHASSMSMIPLATTMESHSTPNGNHLTSVISDVVTDVFASNSVIKEATDGFQSYELGNVQPYSKHHDSKWNRFELESLRTFIASQNGGTIDWNFVSHHFSRSVEECQNAWNSFNSAQFQNNISSSSAMDSTIPFENNQDRTQPINDYQKPFSIEEDSLLMRRVADTSSLFGPKLNSTLFDSLCMMLGNETNRSSMDIRNHLNYLLSSLHQTINGYQNSATMIPNNRDHIHHNSIEPQFASSSDDHINSYYHHHHQLPQPETVSPKQQRKRSRMYMNNNYNNNIKLNPNYHPSYRSPSGEIHTLNHHHDGSSNYQIREQFETIHPTSNSDSTLPPFIDYHQHHVSTAKPNPSLHTAHTLINQYLPPKPTPTLVVGKRELKHRRIYSEKEDLYLIERVKEWKMRGQGIGLWVTVAKEMQRNPKDLKRRFLAIMKPKADLDDSILDVIPNRKEDPIQPNRDMNQMTDGLEMDSNSTDIDFNAMIPANFQIESPTSTNAFQPHHNAPQQDNGHVNYPTHHPLMEVDDFGPHVPSKPPSISSKPKTSESLEPKSIHPTRKPRVPYSEEDDAYILRRVTELIDKGTGLWGIWVKIAKEMGRNPKDLRRRTGVLLTRPGSVVGLNPLQLRSILNIDDNSVEKLIGVSVNTGNASSSRSETVGSHENSLVQAYSSVMSSMGSSLSSKEIHGIAEKQQQSLEDNDDMSEESMDETTSSSNRKRTQEGKDKISGSTNYIRWTREMDRRLQQGVERYGKDWINVAEFVGENVKRHQCSNRWTKKFDPNLIKYKKEPWTAEEVEILKKFIQITATDRPDAVEEGTEGTTKKPLRNWKLISKKLGRSPYDCKNKWSNLNMSTRHSNCKRGHFTEEEDQIIINTVKEFGTVQGGAVWTHLEKVLGRPSVYIRQRWLVPLTKKNLN